MDEKSAKARILDTADHLLPEKAIKKTSVREITTEAKAHLAPVSYPFGFKQGLTSAVLARRTGPLNQERLRIFSDLRA